MKKTRPAVRRTSVRRTPPHQQEVHQWSTISTRGHRLACQRSVSTKSTIESRGIFKIWQLIRFSYSVVRLPITRTLAVDHLQRTTWAIGAKIHRPITVTIAVVVPPPISWPIGVIIHRKEHNILKPALQTGPCVLWTCSQAITQRTNLNPIT